MAESTPKFADAEKLGRKLNRKADAGGARNRLRLELDAIEEALKLGLTPLEFLFAVYRNADVSVELRIEAAKAAAPYVHRRMPQTLEVKNLSDMTDEELMKLAGLVPNQPEVRNPTIALPAPAQTQ